ncbi:uncharacterized protein G2W53_008576 [Senna tora]|uniref:Uncharacterized protein n=1 Tax=Senna tora TaxID=362788 RepID=A0A834X9R8_9FABA|nr:uncharacterized protein G2W53_008576 [Senna tora]
MARSNNVIGAINFVAFFLSILINVVETSTEPADRLLR